MSLPQLITQEQFTTALVSGITIPHTSSTALFDFGHRLIDWINITDNKYWACWNPKEQNDIIIDFGNIAIIHVKLISEKVLFCRPENGAAEDLPKEFGNGAIGIMLFCMIENGEIEELALEDIPKDDEVLASPKADEKEVPDFDWI